MYTAKTRTYRSFWFPGGALKKFEKDKVKLAQEGWSVLDFNYVYIPNTLVHHLVTVTYCKSMQ